MKAIFRTADGFEFLTDIDEARPTVKRALTPTVMSLGRIMGDGEYDLVHEFREYELRQQIGNAYAFYIERYKGPKGVLD